jgi:hypothetical protein
MNNNVITNNTLTGSGEYNAMFNSGITSTAMNVIGNTFSSTAPIATTGSLYFLQSSVSNTGTVAMQNNTFGPFTKSGAGGTVYGYYNNSSPTAAQSITGNTIAGITFSGATTFYGWFINTSTSQTQTIANNTVNNITGGSNTIYGIYANYGSATSVVNNNTVTGLSGQRHGVWPVPGRQPARRQCLLEHRRQPEQLRRQQHGVRPLLFGYQPHHLPQQGL